MVSLPKKKLKKKKSHSSSLQLTTGEIYSAVDMFTGEEVAVKTEPSNTQKFVLKTEAHVMRRLQKSKHVVRYILDGQTEFFYFLVMERLGENLADLRRKTLKACSQASVHNLTWSILGSFFSPHNTSSWNSNAWCTWRHSQFGIFTQRCETCKCGNNKIVEEQNTRLTDSRVKIVQFCGWQEMRRKGFSDRLWSLAKVHNPFGHNSTSKKELRF